MAGEEKENNTIGRREVLEMAGSVGGITALSGDFTHPNRVRTTDCERPLVDGPEGDYNGQSWKIAVLPDTQKYAQHDPEYAEAQTEWIAENHEEENIKFVAHEGDLVHNADRDVEWERINAVMENLDEANIPYGTVPGNHDWKETRDKSSSIEKYRELFGESRFEDSDWYCETGPHGLSDYQIFSANDNEFMHLGLEWEPRDETIEWAEGVVNEHDIPTILTTHSYLTDDFWNAGRTDYVTEKNGDGNHGEYVFQNLVSENDQIFMTFCGHVFKGNNPLEEGEYDQISQNRSGEDVYETLANYQGRRNGGNGWMRLIEFGPGEGSCDLSPDRIDVKTYSPALDKYQTDFSSEFSYELDFEERFESYER